MRLSCAVAALVLVLALAACSQDVHVLDHDAGGDAGSDAGADLGADAPAPDAGCTACPACSNGADDDHDGLVDYPLDPGCTSRDDTDEGEPPPPAACANDVDDDGDGRVDYPADPGCANEEDDDETDPPPPACRNGADDDGDGHADFPLDPGCASADDADETDACPGAGCPECADGTDDDGDGRVDYPLDPECASASDTSERCALLGDGFDGTWPGAWVSDGAPIFGGRRLSCAHDGAYGLFNPMFVTYDPTFSTGAPGETASVYTRTFGDPSSTVVSLHFAIAGSTSYACMLNLAGQLTVYAYGPNTTLDTTPFVRTPDTWYRLEAAFLAGGAVECRVYADGGTTPLATLAHTFGTSLAGPVGVRGFPLAAFDTLTVCR